MSVFSFHIRGERRFWIRMTIGSLLFTLGLLIVVPSMNASTSSNAFKRFLTATESLYDAVNKGELSKAINDLKEIEVQFRNLPMKEIATVDGIHALAQSITDMKRAIAAVKPNEEKWKSGSATLRLAADALVHPDKPIWHQYRSVLQEDLAKMRKAIPQSGTISGPAPESALLAFHQLSEHYRVIRTAAILQTEPWKVERSDSVIRYARRILHADSPTNQLLQGTIQPLQEAMDDLFPGNKETSAAFVPPLPVAPPSWGWSAMMGSFIVTILTWVGWRRYKVDEYSRIVKSPPKRDEQEDAAQRLMKRWNSKDKR
ncbi:hypothetical protein E2980_04525 [Cohnella luojiensis]|uniref:Sporulation protein n=1 Tax=Cohnella luojiensis TaxID=652876 RepID=A0A4Y8M4G4_9BACL|nr:hypothetical protein E2980_04525 [Cohnella luojiensis]